ncbi:MAG: hypothetical protein CSA82_02630, partial [Actinobacteria bacterium]
MPDTSETKSLHEGDSTPVPDAEKARESTKEVAAPQEAESGGAKAFTMNVLNGLALGAVVVLIPGALLGELVRALVSYAPWLQIVLQATMMSNAMMGLVVGFLVGLNFKFTPIQCAAVGVATEFAAGAVQFQEGAMLMKGTGDIITMGLTAAFAAGLVRWMGNSMKAYTILVIPTVVLVIAGIAGRLALPYIAQITHWIGLGISNLLTLQPILMAMLIAVIFSILIVSPVTTVGIALAISLAGIGSGAANLGVCAAGFGFAIAGWQVNAHGTSLAHFLGSPKMSMANVLKKPKILLPILCSAALTGIIGAILGIEGTPMSAGFGFSGLVG